MRLEGPPRKGLRPRRLSSRDGLPGRQPPRENANPARPRQIAWLHAETLCLVAGWQKESYDPVLKLDECRTSKGERRRF
jgi:hypothetical protein